MTDVKQRFISKYGLQAATAIAYAMNTEFSRTLASEMKHYSESGEVDAISRVHGQIDELKNIMVKNIGESMLGKMDNETVPFGYVRLWQKTTFNNKIGCMKIAK